MANGLDPQVGPPKLVPILTNVVGRMLNRQPKLTRALMDILYPLVTPRSLIECDLMGLKPMPPFRESRSTFMMSILESDLSVRVASSELRDIAKGFKFRTFHVSTFASI